MTEDLEPYDLDLPTAAREWCTDELAARWKLSGKRVRALLAPYRTACRRGRRGRHPRLLLWVPIEVVRLLDLERRARLRPAGTCQGRSTRPAEASR